MWSGPRNLSTAMMYSFAQHSDTEVIDEPLYAAYLKDTGLQHPFADEIISGGETNVPTIVKTLSEHACSSKIQYQKHITKHLLDEYPNEWLAKVNNVFLIRHPARVICSYHIKDEDPDVSDIGIEDQWNIYLQTLELGQTPLVVDSADILVNPAHELQRICNHVGIQFEPNRLHWPPGPKSYDGIWAPHWYESVWKSEGFGNPQGPIPEVPEHLKELLAVSLPIYERLREKSRL